MSGACASPSLVVIVVRAISLGWRVVSRLSRRFGYFEDRWESYDHGCTGSSSPNGLVEKRIMAVQPPSLDGLRRPPFSCLSPLCRGRNHALWSRTGRLAPAQPSNGHGEWCSGPRLREGLDVPARRSPLSLPCASLGPTASQRRRWNRLSLVWGSQRANLAFGGKERGAYR